MYNSKNLPLNSRKIIKKTVALFITFYALVLAAPLALIIPLSSISSKWYEIIWPYFLPALFISSIVVLALSILYSYFYYKTYYYRFDEMGADIRKGVFTKATGHIAYNRLQNILVDQDFFDQLMGLYDVHYETAGHTSNFYFHVDGLDHTNAETLITFLKSKMKN